MSKDKSEGCTCEAWRKSECACGLYGTTPSPTGSELIDELVAILEDRCHEFQLGGDTRAVVAFIVNHPKIGRAALTAKDERIKELASALERVVAHASSYDDFVGSGAHDEALAALANQKQESAPWI